MVNMNKIQLFIVSRQTIFRQGIEHSLIKEEDIGISGVPEMDDIAWAGVDDNPPDVALIDIDGATDDGLMLGRRLKLRSPSIGVIMMASQPNDAQLFQALKAQAVAYVGKEVSADELANLVRRVSHGEHPINDSLTSRPKVAEQVLNQFQELYWKNDTDAFISPLTPRETEILNYIAQGYLNKQIAGELGISEQTIKNHVTSILRKLNANARTEAVVVAIKQGLISIK
jgi:DNA-binding NarL/FixJ family response regulator